MTTGVRAAFRDFLSQARRLGWQTLLLGSGLWLEAALCAERFVVDLANALDLRRPAHARYTRSRILGGVSGRLVCAVRWCAPGARAWRRLAAQTDAAFLARRYPTTPVASQVVAISDRPYPDRTP